MKTLIVIRHAKSDWSTAHSDFDRPITPARQADTSRVAKAIKRELLIPQLVVASAAKRASQTAALFCKTWDYPVEAIETDRSIYMCTVDHFATRIKAIDSNHHCIAIVAHNPTVTDFVNDYSDQFLIEIPTSGAVCIHFDVDHWHEISKTKKGKVKVYLQPKDLK